MRRLSIVDLGTGQQPIANEDGSIWVVFNGEIYNYKQLRADLIAAGHRFTTSSDTETLVHLYEEEGVQGLNRLRGMFAFCIWDNRRQQILLVRDRFGKKPLYYAETPKGIYFASELKCLRVAGVPLELDEEALRYYFQFSYIPDPLSPFRAIRKLSPGGWMICRNGSIAQQGRYWRLPVPSEKDSLEMPEPELCERLREKFDECVRVRMEADVPLGAFLSGGIDSGSVVASMARQSGAPVKTFSIGFEEQGFNELPYASMLAKQYGTEHHEILVRPDAVGLVSRLIRHFDEPFGDSSAIPTFIVSEFASRYVKVALSGDGGDELFGGYESFFAVEKFRRADYSPQGLRRLISAVADRLPYSAYGKNWLRMISRPTGLERYFENNYAPYFFRKQMLQAEWMLPADAAFLSTAFADCLPSKASRTVTQAMYFETASNLTGDMLVKVDRMSMANSLEVRCPLLDHELTELAANIPFGWKVRKGRGKYILIKALGDRLPEPLLNRPKMGFGVPLGSWFRTSLRDFLLDHLTEARISERGIVNGSFLKLVLDEHMSGRRNNQHWLWTLLMLELWLREFENIPQRSEAQAISYALSS
jgi:asparagine synthase (glutamine-hydrolysing)